MARQAERRLDARPDTVDFRDLMYVPTLIQVPPERKPDLFSHLEVPVLDQGSDGGCTGYALATVANYLLWSRDPAPDHTPVSPQMFYDLARRYDEWPGEGYEGSSARGAMKGWHRHGVCSADRWGEVKDGDIPRDVARDALRRPLGAYFRVNHKDLVAVHSAISEVGVLYATGLVHKGWQVPDAEGRITLSQDIIGSHAFAIIGYDALGLWLQNSWGAAWGLNGIAHIGYSDWLNNGLDLWVARLGAPVDLGDVEATAALRAAATRAYQSNSNFALKPYVISVGDDGVLASNGDFGLTPAGLETLVKTDMVRKMSTWSRKRVVLYAHGGLTSEDDAALSISKLRDPVLAAEVYPLSFLWHSDLLSTLGDIFRTGLASRQSGDGLLSFGDLLYDRIDNTLEPLARTLGGKRLWDEMKQNAMAATQRADGAVRLTVNHLIALHSAGEIDEIHLVGFSAGAVMLAPLVELLAQANVPIESCTLWAPALAMTLFDRYYRPALETPGKIVRFGLYTLSDVAEQADDCAHLYHKSLLYLVSGAFEARAHVPGISAGEPLLGLQRDVAKDQALTAMLRQAGREWIIAPETKSPSRSQCRNHGKFDDDCATRTSTLRRIVNSAAGMRPALATFRTPQTASM